MTKTNENKAIDSYLVGGAVRDKLLNRKIVERDYVVVGANVETMLALGFNQVGKDFPVFLHPKTKEEFALARTEKKQGQGYTGFICYASPEVTLEQDLLRRDLTVNAMAEDSNGDIIDPYNGQQDLQNRILRHVSPAFSEDPLRVLRVARFAARYHYLGFSIATETLTLMSTISRSGELNTLSAERIWKEMQRSIDEANPEVFFQVLRQCGALEKLWPELNALWGIPNPARWHPEICSGIHTMMALKQAVKLTTTEPVNKTSIRFATLCHDLGKTLSPIDDLPRHLGHEKAGIPLVENICQRLKIPNQVKSLALKVCEFHLHCHKAFELKPTTILKLFNKIDLWRKSEEFESFLIACQADFLGRKGNENKDYPQASYLREIASLARQVTAKSFVEQGLKGIEIKNAMKDAQLDIIKQFVSLQVPQQK